MKKSFLVSLFLSVVSAAVIACVCVTFCGKLGGKAPADPSAARLEIAENMTAYLGQKVTLTPYLTDKDGKFVRGEYSYSTESECIKFESENEGAFTVAEYSDEPQKITVTETTTLLHKEVAVKIVRGELLDVVDVLLGIGDGESAEEGARFDYGSEFSLAVLSIPQNVPIAPFISCSVTDKSGNEIDDAFDVRYENTTAYFVPTCLGEGVLRVTIENESGSVRREYEYGFTSAMRDGAVQEAMEKALPNKSLCGKADIARVERLSVVAESGELDATGMDRLSLRGLLLANEKVVAVTDGELPGCDIYVPDTLMREYSTDERFAGEYHRVYPKRAYDEDAPCLVYESGNDAISLDPMLLRELSKLETVSAEGCGFGGWKTADGEKVTYEQIIERGKNVHLYAEWNPELYTVTLSYNEATANCDLPDFEVYYGNALSELPTPYKDGYEFEGWYREETSEKKITAETVFDFTDDITLYARWSTSFTLYYDLYDLTSEVKVRYKGILSLPENLAFNGWILDGWYTESGGKGERVDGTFDSGYTGIGGKVLHAKWTRSVKLEYEGATVDTGKCPTAMKITYGLPLKQHDGFVENPTGSESVLVTLPSASGSGMTLTGWQFGGWYTERAGGGEQVLADEPFPDAGTLYAKWSTQINVTDTKTQNTFTGIQLVIGESVPFYTSEILEKLKSPGFAFSYWTYISGGKTVNVYEGAKVVADMKTDSFQAVWGANPHTITFDPLVVTTTKSKQVSYNAAIGAVDSFVPVVDNLKFAGWYYKNEQITSSTVYRWDNDITVTAKWEGYYTRLRSGDYASSVRGVTVSEHTFDLSALGSNSASVNVVLADSTTKVTVIGNKNYEYNLSFDVSTSRTAPITLALRDVKLKANLYLGDGNSAIMNISGSVTVSGAREVSTIHSGPLTVNGTGHLSVIGRNGSTGVIGQKAVHCKSLEIAADLSGYSFTAGAGGDGSGSGAAGKDGGVAVLSDGNTTLRAPGSFIGGKGGNGTTGAVGSAGGKGGSGGIGLYTDKLYVYAVVESKGGAGGIGGVGGVGSAGSKGNKSKKGTDGGTGGAGGAGGAGAAAFYAKSVTFSNLGGRLTATNGSGGSGATGGAGGKGGAGGDAYSNWFFNIDAYNGKAAGNGGTGGTGGARGAAGSISAYSSDNAASVKTVAGSAGKTGNGGVGGEGGDKGSDSKSGAYSNKGGAAGSGGSGGYSGGGSAGKPGNGKSGGAGGSDY